MAGVAGVCGDGCGSPFELVCLYRVQVWKGETHNALCCSHHLGELFPLQCHAAAIPHCHITAEDAFNCGLVEVHEQL